MPAEAKAEAGLGENRTVMREKILLPVGDSTSEIIIGMSFGPRNP